MKGIFTWLIACLVFLTGAACGDNLDGNPFVSLSLSPPVEISVGSDQQVIATAARKDGETTDVSSQSKWASSDSAIAYVVDGRVRGVAKGDVTISATFGGLSATLPIRVIPARTITAIAITPAVVSLPKGVKRQIVATATYSDASTADVTDQAQWTSSAPDRVTITSVGEALALSEGQAVISATYAGVSAQAEVLVSSATLASLSVTPAQTTLGRGVQVQLTATGVFSDATTADLTSQVTWRSNTATVAAVQPSGVVTGVAGGTAMIVASLWGLDGFAVVDVTGAQLQRIEITPPNPSLARGARLALQATAIYSDGTTNDVSALVAWESVDTAIATIDANGQLLGIAEGSTLVTAMFAGTQASTTVTVTSATLLRLEISPQTPRLAAGRQLQMTATAVYSDASVADVTASVTWSSSEQSVASISNADGSRGTVAARAPGTSQVVATLATVSASTVITVTNAQLTEITITPSIATLAQGTTLAYTAIATFSDASTLDVTQTATWASSDIALATVSNADGMRGLATPRAPGSLAVTATQDGITGTAQLTVTRATVRSVEISPNTPTIASGQTQAFTAIAVLSDNSTQDVTEACAWASTAPAIATVSNANGTAGLATGHEAGTTIISALCEGVTGQTTLTVTGATLTRIEVTPPMATVPRGRTQAFVATGFYSDGAVLDLSSQVTWTATPTAVATIMNGGTSGLATGSTPGTATIIAALGAVHGTATMVVTTAELVSLSVTPVARTLPRGRTLQFVATGTYSDGSTQNLSAQVTWGSSNPMIASVSNSVGSQGLATAIAVGTTDIAATLGPISAQTTLRVSAAVLANLAVTPSDAQLARGTQQRYTAVGTFTDGRVQDLTAQVTWSTGDSAIATISNAIGQQGHLTAIATGTTFVRATLSNVAGQTNVTVTSATLTHLAISPSNPVLAAGQQLSLQATGTYTDGTTHDLTTQVTWATSNAVVATVSNATGEEGHLQTAGQGVATILATLDGVVGTTRITVTNAVLTGIEVSPTAATVPRGLRQPMTATGLYSDNSRSDLTQQVTWTSTNLAVAVVSNADGSNGIVEALTPGTVTISARWAGLEATTTLVVTTATIVSIEVAPTQTSLAAGTTANFTATATYSDGTSADITNQAVWSSSRPAIATVSNAEGSTGQVQAHTVGTTTIQAALGMASGSVNLVVTDAVLTQINVEPVESTVPLGLTQQFSANGVFSNGTVQDITSLVTWRSSNETIATIENAAGVEGKALGLAVGTTEISASLEGRRGAVTLLVTPATLQRITVTPPSRNLPRGVSQPYVAIGTLSDGASVDLTTQVTWASSLPAVATISNAAGTQGIATALTVGTTEISARLGQTSGFAQLRVTAASLTALSVTPLSMTLPRGMTQQYAAVGTFSDGTTRDLTSLVTWSTSTPAVATISNTAGRKGVLTAQTPGGAQVRARRAGIQGQAAVTVTNAVLSSLSVTPATPRLAIGVALQLTATGRFSDGSTHDVTAQVTWASSNPNVAQVSNTAGVAGLLTAVSPGQCLGIATYGNSSGSTQVEVTP